MAWLLLLPHPSWARKPQGPGQAQVRSFGPHSHSGHIDRLHVSLQFICPPVPVSVSKQAHTAVQGAKSYQTLECVVCKANSKLTAPRSGSGRPAFVNNADPKRLTMNSQKSRFSPFLTNHRDGLLVACPAHQQCLFVLIQFLDITESLASGKAPIILTYKFDCSFISRLMGKPVTTGVGKGQKRPPGSALWEFIYNSFASASFPFEMQMFGPNLSATPNSAGVRKTRYLVDRCDTQGLERLVWKKRRRGTQFYSWEGGISWEGWGTLDSCRGHHESMGQKNTILFSLQGAVQFPWPKWVYVRESRVLPSSLLCQEERRKTRENGRSRKWLWFGHQVGLPVLRSVCPLLLLPQMASRRGKKPKALGLIRFGSFNYP